MIRINKNREYFGAFDNPHLAAYAYNVAIPRITDTYQLNVINEDLLNDNDKQYVRSVVNKRFNKIRSKYRLSVSDEFKWNGRRGKSESKL
jgi:hypothetical protein